MNLQNSALLLIEYQNEWLSDDGKLKHLFLDREQFHASIDHAKNIIKAARNSKINIIHSGLTYTKNYKELGNANHGLRAVIPKNNTFLSNTNASQFTKPFIPEDNEFIVQGRIGSSAFSGSNLDAYLRNNRIQTLFIMGYALHVCVESTLRAAHDLGYEVIVLDEASAAFTQEQRQYFLDHIIHHFGENINTVDFLNILNEVK